MWRHPKPGSQRSEDSEAKRVQTLQTPIDAQIVDEGTRQKQSETSQNI